MSGAVQLHPLPEAAYALEVKGFKPHPAQQTHIRRLDGRVMHHGLILLVCTAVVALAAAPIGVAGIVVHVPRLVGAIRAGNPYHNDVVAIHLLHIHVLPGQNVDTDLQGIVDNAPELADQPVRVGQIHGIEGLVRRFDDAQQNDTAQRVGKGGVGLPDALGQAAQRFLGLYAVVFPVLLQAAEVEHGVTSYGVILAYSTLKFLFANFHSHDKFIVV